MSGISNTPGERYDLRLRAEPSDRLRTSLEAFFAPPGDDAEARALGARALTLHSLQVAVFEVPAEREGRGFYGEGQGIVLGKYMNDLNKIRMNKFRVDADEGASGITATPSGATDVWLTLRPTAPERRVLVQPPLFERDQQTPDLGMYLRIEQDEYVGNAAAKVALNALRMRIKAEDELLEAAKRAAEAEDDFDDLNSFGPRTPKPLRELYLTKLGIMRSPSEIVPPPVEQPPHEYRSAA